MEHPTLWSFKSFSPVINKPIQYISNSKCKEHIKVADKFAKGKMDPNVFQCNLVFSSQGSDQNEHKQRRCIHLVILDHVIVEEMHYSSVFCPLDKNITICLVWWWWWLWRCSWLWSLYNQTQGCCSWWCMRMMVMAMWAISICEASFKVLSGNKRAIFIFNLLESSRPAQYGSINNIKYQNISSSQPHTLQ